ncbi:MAG TPA: hypothetical protein VJ892_02410 [Candidatus Absconditabacterales bacterium]|nr:hypothetical protein [Candidatus Absconditabacterales bacterium]
MKKSLLAVFVLGLATLVLAGCMTNDVEDLVDETVNEEDVVVELEVTEEEEEALEGAAEEILDEEVENKTGANEEEVLNEDEEVTE